MKRGRLFYAVLVVGQNVFSGEEGRSVAEVEKFRGPRGRKSRGHIRSSVTRSTKAHRGKRFSIETRRRISRQMKSTTTRLEARWRFSQRQAANRPFLGKVSCHLPSCPMASWIRDRSAVQASASWSSHALAWIAILTENHLTRSRLVVANGRCLGTRAKWLYVDPWDRLQG